MQSSGLNSPKDVSSPTDELSENHDLAGRILFRLGSMTLAALTVVKAVGLDRLLQLCTTPLRWFLAICVWITSLGTRRGGRWDPSKKFPSNFTPYSAINVTDDTFKPPKEPNGQSVYKLKDFPFAADTKPGDIYCLHEWRAHFLSLCVKAAYEHPNMFSDIVKTDWKPFIFVRLFKTEDPPAEERLQKSKATVNDARHKQLVRRFLQSTGGSDDEEKAKKAEKKAKVLDSFMPQTRAFVISNDNAVTLIFRGTEPTNLTQWATDASCDMKTKPEAYGKVHEGFYMALFYNSKPGEELMVNKLSMFRRICDYLAYLDKHDKGRGAEGAKSLYITGHSLGGALVSVFANCLAKLATTQWSPQQIEDWKKGPEIVQTLMDRIKNGGGIYTFAGPLVGNEDFREFLSRQYGRNIYRFVHAGDWIPQVPPYYLGYRHHIFEYYINSLGDVLTKRDAIEFWRGIETSPITFMVMYIYKIVACPFLDGETFVRTVERILMMFVVPGLADHWPSDYERRLRKYCFKDAKVNQKMNQQAAPIGSTVRDDAGGPYIKAGVEV